MTLPEQMHLPKTAEVLAAELRRQVVRGELQDGDALPPEAVLTARYGVSRPTLREAFRVLESESLISIRRGVRGGARVRMPSARVAARHAGILLQLRGTTLSDVHRARQVIEPGAAHLLAATGGAASVAALESALATEAAALDDPVAAGAAFVAFHQRVVDDAGNVTLAVLAGMIGDIVEIHTRATIADGAGSPTHRAELQASHRAHAHLVHLVRARDASAAEQHWRDHLDAVGCYLLRGSRADAPIDLFG